MSPKVGRDRRAGFRQGSYLQGIIHLGPLRRRESSLYCSRNGPQGHCSDLPETHRLVAFDYGAKKAIYQNLRRHGFEVIVLPADASAEEAKSHDPDAIFLSTGPGDPSALDYAHETVRQLMADYPVFGICLGHQVLTHAIGANTYKLKSSSPEGPTNQSKTLKRNGLITSQNHGFASEKNLLKKGGPSLPNTT